MTFPLPALSNLLNAVGETLKPEVTAVIDLKVREDLKGPGELVISKGSAGAPPRPQRPPGANLGDNFSLVFRTDRQIQRFVAPLIIKPLEKICPAP